MTGTRGPTPFIGFLQLSGQALAALDSTVRVLGLDSSGQVVFDLAYRNTSACDTSWNAVPVPFDALRFDE